MVDRFFLFFSVMNLRNKQMNYRKKAVGLFNDWLNLTAKDSNMYKLLCTISTCLIILTSHIGALMPLVYCDKKTST